MLNRNIIFKKIHPTASLISIISVISCLFIAKSIYLVLFITSLSLIICILSSIKVFDFVKFLKNRIILLLIFLIAYIIITGEYNFINILLIFLKIIVISLFIYSFEFSLDFDKLHEAIYGLLYPIKRFNRRQISYNIALSLVIIKTWFDSKELIKNSQTYLKQKSIRFYKIFSLRTIFFVSQIKKLQICQKLNKYNLKYNKVDFKSKICIITFIVFFVVCIFREVIF